LTNTGRTLMRLRRCGFMSAVVEKWLRKIDRRQDLWGFADVIACHPREGFLLVQTTSAAHVGDRLAKAKARPELAIWLAAGGRFEVHGWARRAGGWRCRVVEVRAGDLEPMELVALPKRRRGRLLQPASLFS